MPLGEASSVRARGDPLDDRDGCKDDREGGGNLECDNDVARKQSGPRHSGSGRGIDNDEPKQRLPDGPSPPRHEGGLIDRRNPETDDGRCHFLLRVAHRGQGSHESSNQDTAPIVSAASRSDTPACESDSAS